MSDAPSPFSKILPKLQLAWDPTSLTRLMKCPRYYELKQIEGYSVPDVCLEFGVGSNSPWAGSNGGRIDLDFGLHFHTAAENYQRLRSEGADKEAALCETVRRAVSDTAMVVYAEGDEDGNNAPLRFWSGEYVDAWRCIGTEPYKNDKGNRAKCPHAHKGVWQDTDNPGQCGNCGSTTEAQVQWVSQKKTKDRYALVRLIIWFIDSMDGLEELGFGPITMPDGKPAIEVPIRIPSGIEADTGEMFILSGYLDRIVSYLGDIWVVDLKTTAKGLTENWFSGWSPNTQFDIYDLISNILLVDMGVKGVMVQACQTLVDSAEFGHRTYPKSDEQREELLKDLRVWFEQAEDYARADYWPMNRSSCTWCDFRKYCSMKPESRKAFMDAELEVRHWNPLEDR